MCQIVPGDQKELFKLAVQLRNWPNRSRRSQVMRLTKNIISFSNFPIFCVIFLIFRSVRTFYEVLENIKKKDE
jgi:hypothetical protein